MSGFLQAGCPPLILASASKARAQLLEAAGLAFIVEPAGLDEDTMRQAVSGEKSLDPHDVAELLARAKAEAVSEVAKGAFVIGADQVLAIKDRILVKPGSMEDARKQLLELSGKAHTLHTSVVVAKDGEAILAHTETATLVMRNLTPQFVGRYLAAVGEAVLPNHNDALAKRNIFLLLLHLISVSKKFLML